MNKEYDITSDEKKMLRQVFWRSFAIFGSFNMMRMEGIGFLYAMLPVINRFCKTPEEKKAALVRHTAFYNTTPYIVTFPMGLAASMEKENSMKPGFDPASINAVKAGLMGPLAGIGDSFFWGTFRVIAAGLGIALAQQGNLLGPVLFILLFNIPHLIAKYYGTFWGYTLGSKYIETAYESGIIKTITKAAAILGLIMVGAMTSTMVNFKLTWVLQLGQMKLVFQDVLDQIMLGILPLSITLICFYLIRKKVNINYILLGILVFSLLVRMIGIA